MNSIVSYEALEVKDGVLVAVTISGAPAPTDIPYIRVGEVVNVSAGNCQCAGDIKVPGSDRWVSSEKLTHLGGYIGVRDGGWVIFCSSYTDALNCAFRTSVAACG